jgi:hypothetical protein
LKGGGWRSSTHVAVYDPTNPDVPTLSDGEAAIIAYGRAFGDSSKGKVMFQAGHNFDKGNAAAVSAIRAFFNFSYLSVLDKIVTPAINGPITLSGKGGSKYPFTATLPQGYNPALYSFHWSSNTAGTFTNEFGTATDFIPAGVASPATCIIMVTITDGCGREYYQTIDFAVQPANPVALDRTAAMLVNSPGSGAKAIGSLTPLAGTDADGYVVNYIIKSLPASGVLYYDNDNNPATADIAITSIPSGGLSLTATKMKSVKYDAVDNFGGSVSFQYTVQDNANLFSTNTAVYTIPVNPPPVTQTFVCAPAGSNADKTKVCPLVATDNHSVVSYTVVTLPAATKCVVSLYNVPLKEGQVLMPQQVSELYYKPSGTYIGYAEITYTATDDEGASDETVSTITLQMVNQAPVAQDVSANVINNPVGTVQVSIAALNAIDLDGTVVSYLVTNAPSPSTGILYYNNGGTYTRVNDNQVLTLAQSSTLKFDPVDTYQGVAKFKYTATDNGNLTGPIPATYSIPVKKVTPVTKSVTSSNIYVGVGSASLTAISATTSDNTKTITSFIFKSVPGADKGKLYSHVTGTTYQLVTSGMEVTDRAIRFEPNPTYTGNYVFTYVGKDNEGLVDPTPATYTIPVVNQAPNAVNVNNNVVYDTSSIVNLKPLVATDGDGVVSKFLIVSLPDASTGTLMLNNNAVTLGQELTLSEGGSLQFIPVPHNSQDAVFTYNAVDDYGLADAAAATFTIPISFIEYKKPPTADAKTTTAINHKPNRILLPVSGSDEDGTVTSFKITKIKAGDGTIYLQGLPVTQNQVISSDVADKLTYTANSSFTGTTTFNYVAIDNDGLISSEVTYSIPVVNTKPIANNFTASQVKTNFTTGLQGLDAADDDGSIASFKILSLPASGTLQFDSTGAGVWKNITGIKVLTAAQAGRIRIAAGGTSGIVSFTFSAKDNLGDTSNVATYQVPVGGTAGNQNPVVFNVTTSAIAMTAGATLISPLTGSDPDGTILAYVIQSIPPSYHGTILYDSAGYWSVLRGVLTISPLQATTLKFIPSGIYTGNVTFTFKSIDATNQFSAIEATYTIPVVNTITVSNITNAAIVNNGPATLSSLTGTGRITKYFITELPDASTGKLVMDGTFITVNQEIPAANAGRIEFQPATDFKGNTSFKYTAGDNQGNYAATAATFTIPVTDQVPVAFNKTSQVITNIIGTGVQDIPALTAIDYDGSISGYYIKTLPTGGKLYKNGTLITTIPVGGLSITNAQASQLSFDPDDNFGGIATFTYTAKDNSNNLSAAATYQVIVNTPPVTNNLSSLAMYAGQPRTGLTALNGTDDGTVAFYSIVTLPASTEGTIFLNNVPVTSLSQVDSITPAQVSQLSFQPTPDFDGVIFTYTATDNTGLIDVTPAVYDIPASSMGTLNPLPLELLSFSGYKSSTDNILYWSMSQEINSDHYEVERSLNGTNYVKIGTVAATGNSSTKTNYSFNDRNVSAGNNYYRIKLVDIDGEYKYSKTIAIKRNSNTVAATKILTNPFVDKLVIELMVINEGKTTFTLYDLKGTAIKKIVMSTPKGMNHIEIESLSNISSAIYMLNISNNDGKSNTQLYKAN